MISLQEPQKSDEDAVIKEIKQLDTDVETLKQQSGKNHQNPNSSPIILFIIHKNGQLPTTSHFKNDIYDSKKNHVPMKLSMKSIVKECNVT